LTTITTSRSTPVIGSFNEKCKAPPQPENGEWKLYHCPNESCDVAEGEELRLGSRIVYSCNPGYRLNGSADASCALQGEWITIPGCTGIEKFFQKHDMYNLRIDI